MNTIHRCLLGIILSSVLFGENLNLSILTDLVLNQNIAIKSSEKEINIKSSELLQSKMFENPSIEIATGFGNETEVSTMLSQTIPIGRKRRHNIHLHELELERAKIEHTNIQSQKLTEAYMLFVEVLQFQEKRLLLEKQIEVSEELLIAVEKKVTAGKLSTAEISRAKIQLYQEISGFRKIENTLQIKWKELETFWSESQPTFTQGIGNIATLFDYPSVLSIENSLEYKQAKIQVDIQNTAINLEKSNRIPDIEIGAGVRQSDFTDNTLNFGLSIPLPIFNRNKNNINIAKLQLDKSTLDLSDQSLKIQTKISNIEHKLKELKIEIEVLKNDIIPEANSAYLVINNGYLNGRFTYLDIVDAKKMWFETKNQILDALAEYQIEILKLRHISGNINQNLLGEN
ncbi:MAG: TolC family protein [Candidatus Marinimicrobia bacterium]|nr:TolC family protein [Candidatus Neomarinimicrobiota bacterium]MBL7023763.1 TolC family protein [Candidatus Neomarinimicrobiota bacterium]MBL7109404.1 TolC family protein [Candidatus Neomarinimicrobiota bacterium]